MFQCGGSSTRSDCRRGEWQLQELVVVATMDRSMTWTPHQHHRRGHSLGGGAMREKDEDLALFKDMGKQRDKPQFLCTEDQLLDASLCKY